MGLAVPAAQPGTSAAAAPCTSATATESAAVAEARRCAIEVAVTDLTTEATEVVAQPDGQLRATVSAGAVRVRRGGAWVPVDLTLRHQPDGSVAPVADPFNVRLSGARDAPAGADHGDLALIGSGNDRLSIGWAGRLATPVLTGNRATYAEALPGVDLVVEVTRKGVETFFVVKSRTAVDQVRRLSLPVSGPNVARHRRDAGGNVAFLAADGRVIANSPAPEMWDAATDPRAAIGDSARRHPVASTVQRAAVRSKGFAFVLTPDPKWLTAPERDFPLTIDPTVNPVSVNFDTYVLEGENVDRSGANDLRLGRQGSTGPITRSFVRWNTSALANTQVTSATTYFWNWYSTTCAAKGWEIWTTTAVSAATRWAAQPQWLDGDPTVTGDQPESTSTSTRGFNTTCDDNWASADTTKFFNRASMAGESNATMGLRGTSETDWLHFKQFRSQHPDNGVHSPYSVVTYNRLPTVTARSTVPASACAVGASRPAIASFTPQLSATVADADGSASTVKFEWSTLNGSAPLGSATVSAVASGATASATIPAGSLPRAGSYRWRVLVSDATATTTSSWCEFTAWEFAPPADGCAGSADNDYDGDGVTDVVISDPRATVSGHADAGAVHVVTGSSGAVSTLTEASADVPGEAETGDRFGHALASYDVNRDGCTDLAVGVPFEDQTGVADAGSVRILLGSPGGLGKGPAAVAMEQGLSGTPETAEAGDWFGWSLAAGTTAADEPYLVVGAPGEDAGATVDAGTVHYRRRAVNVALPGLSPEGAEQDDRTGYAVAATPYHIAFSQPGEKIGDQAFAGSACLASHTLVGGVPGPMRCLHQNEPDVSDSVEANDNFGKSISMAPYRPVGAPAGQPDSILVVGVPGENQTAANIEDTGLVQQFHVSGSGATELPWVDQNTPGVGGAVEPGDYFGEKVLVVNTNPAAEASPQTVLLAVGTPAEDLEGTTEDAGAVRVFPAARNSGFTSVVVERGGNLPGPRVPQEFIGSAIGANAQHLFVGAPYGDGTVWAIPWASLATGSGAPARTYQAGEGGLPADGVAFGAVIR